MVHMRYMDTTRMQALATPVITNAYEPAAWDEERQWQSVLARDVEADGAFVYAVRTTGIYCRPICPSRRPRREHVVFFTLPEAAERAGFRACRRCHPEQATLRDPQVDIVRRVCHAIAANPEEPPTLAGLSAAVGLSPFHVQRMFKRVMGITPRQYATACRMDRLKGELRKGEAVTSALYGAGYGSPSRLYERAPAQLGMTPAVYRRGGAGMRIHYTVVPCPLGLLLVAATERGICAITLGGVDDALADGLSKEYPAATITRDASGLDTAVAAIIRHLHGQEPHLDLPLDMQATAFQWRVWEALQAIPYGSTRSYGEIARAIGQPTAARAVAQACATNRVALAIPCHRVVRENGDVGGYRWGVERKRTLLAQEQAGT
ncbi:MAG: bifunctional DNA-binding transcriptional regulator/O6-methylguanine-DNA methyltransferase Ada [Chloroflexota bacterium]|nr:bifunctional DNA-binding transcriptional regulator/O6-methylguanine-DNA methyltransferase Ada [Chloroflexota bacterium]